MSKISFLSNINMDPIGRFFDSKSDDLFFANYNQYIFELIDKKSKTNKDNFDIVILHLDGSEFLSGHTNSKNNISTKKNKIRAELNSLFNSIEIYLKNNKKSYFIINTLSIPPFFMNTFLDNNPSYSSTILKNYVNDKMKKFVLKHTNLVIMDLERIINLYGYNNLYDEKFYYLGRIKYNHLGLSVIYEEVKRLVKAFTGKTKKAIILDLDNTLWGGVIGEDGLSGVKLSEDGIGKVYRDFQKILKRIKDQGIILAVCSKNNLSDVEDFFNKHPMMILKLKDFVSIKANWDDKVSNILEISRDLSLGLDSFVFIDDNPVEREMVKENIPDIESPDFPLEPSYLNKWFVSEVMYDFFPKLFLTGEDKNKTNQYIANSKRAKSSKSLDMNTFIKNLKIKLKLLIDDKKFIDRFSQLTQKTNQFNMTTQRYTNVDIESFMNSKNYLVFGIEYEDRFNNEGIVGTSIVKTDNTSATIDTFLMSCRVIGRNVEYQFLNLIIKYLHLHYNRLSTLRSHYYPSAKNEVSKDFYKNSNLNFYKEDSGNFFYKSSLKSLLDK